MACFLRRLVNVIEAFSSQLCVNNYQTWTIMSIFCLKRDGWILFFGWPLEIQFVRLWLWKHKGWKNLDLHCDKVGSGSGKWFSLLILQIYLRQKYSQRIYWIEIILIKWTVTNWGQVNEKKTCKNLILQLSLLAFNVYFYTPFNRFDLKIC